MSAGVEIGGKIIPIPGVDVTSWREAMWLKCAGRSRSTRWVRQLFLHKTIADDPEKILAGAGPSGGAQQTVEGWALGVDGAHGVFDYDGRLFQLVDLQLAETYHATASNEWSVGFEMKEQPGGGVFQATLDAAVATTLAVCEALGIQLQMPKLGTYDGHPIPRMAERGRSPGGPNMVGVFGHRDNTERRGRWDPGDVVFQMLADRGVEQFDFAHLEDLSVWQDRQQWLVQQGHQLTVDGVPGPATTAALRAEGYRSGIWALGRAA